MESSKKKIQKGWAFYDWANSVYSLVITTSIFPLYFGAIIPSNRSLEFLGINFSQKDVLYNYAIAFSFLLVVILSPLLSSLADKYGNKLFFMKLFCYLGSASCALLFFFTGIETLWIGIFCSILASVGFWGSLVFYNSYLTEIADPNERDALSAKGFSLGYLGSSILLIICLAMVLGIDESLTRYSFILVAIWWAGFAQYTFVRLPTKSVVTTTNPGKNPYSVLLAVSKNVLYTKNTNVFLIAFFCLSVGVQTIIYTATRFGDEELGLGTEELIITVLVIQFIGIAGANIFAWLSNKIGNITALQVCMLFWTLIGFGAYLMNAEDESITIQFYTLGGMVGLVMGGVQSLARSTYSKLIPSVGNTTTYFSFFDVVEKVALILGTFLAGILISLTGGMRITVLVLAIFFVVALVLLFFVKVKSTR